MELYRHKVQYYETDQMGIVHHSNYIRWFEEARTYLMEELGLSYGQMEQEGIICPVLSAQAKYLKMVHFGETVKIAAIVKEYNGIKMTLEYKVMDLEEKIMYTEGETQHCFLEQESGRPISLKRKSPHFHEMFQNSMEEEKHRKSTER